MTRDLVRLEGLFVGGSGGAAVAGAIKYAISGAQREHPGPHARRRVEVHLKDSQRRLDARERIPGGERKGSARSATCSRANPPTS